MAAFFTWITVWILIGFWVLNDTEPRNMNDLVWSIVVAVFNLLGLAVYLIARTMNPIPRTEEMLIKDRQSRQ